MKVLAMTESPAAGAEIAARPESRAAKALRDAFDSGRPLTYIQSTEEMRVARVLREVARRVGNTQVWTWTLTEGLSRDGQAPEAGTQSARGVLDFIVAHNSPGIFHLKDFHESMLAAAEVRRRVRDLYAICQGQEKYVVITAPVRTIPEEVERSMLFLE